MPTTQSKRIYVLKSSFSAATVSELNVSADAVFNVAGTANNRFEDASSGDTEDITKNRVKFANAAGLEIGQVTFQLTGQGEIGVSGVAVEKTTARSVHSPTAKEGPVNMLTNPDTSIERVWKQAALDDASETEYVDDIAKLDIRVDGSNGYTVSQTVQTQTDNQLVVGYAWTDPNGVSVVSGTITLDSAVSFDAGYHGGRIRVTDNIPSSGERRRG